MRKAMQNQAAFFHMSESGSLTLLTQMGGRMRSESTLEDGEKIYSWWSNRGQARALNRGWRIDYFLLNPAAAALVENVSIERQGGIDVSDHAPVILDLKL